MTTYAAYQEQIAELKAKAESVRQAEISNAKAQIREIMEAYGLSISDLAPAGKVKKDSPRAPVPAKYRDSATGHEWTGRGRAPRWLDGKDKEQFLIK